MARVSFRLRSLTAAAVTATVVVGCFATPAPAQAPGQYPAQPTPRRDRPVIQMLARAATSNLPQGPRLEAVAETKLLMDGLAKPNLNGLERLLKEPPTDAEAWTFARGQALLLAETGNLLMLRPPRNTGQALWMERATELRTNSAALARTIARRDYAASRAGLADLAGSCNRCHQSFRVAVTIEPFAAVPPTPPPASPPATP